ncbi:hypothetical protein HPB49_009085 [Dermacentor silvarum]|uniref:Uncharacterized protein n=1 Tax=Dermacentor silvarum TaxID=543639 RepID=A0ACB8DY20_DERSI|nr:uncharacterized protein LOC125947267 [Dermacentor silvarum]KAH7979342.1 hypothetical protein HPB49_009085 [Dermacentor silvarum]
MEPIFASDDMHVSANGGAAFNGAASASHAVHAVNNISSWGNVIAANASRARKLARRDDLAAAKVVGIWLGCFFIIFLVVGIPNYIQKKMREAQENNERMSALEGIERRLSTGELRSSE